MGIVAPEEGNDYSWNQQGVEGAEAAAAASGATAEVADGAGYEDITPILQQLADDGANLIIAHASGYNTAAPEWAAESGIPVLIPDNPAATTPGLVANMVFKSEQGAYLAGVLAAKMTKTGTLGLVVSADNENWNKQSGAFAAGAQSADPAIKILRVQIGEAAYADAAGGKRVTKSVIAAGADIIFGMGDGASFGMMQAIETATPPEGADKVWFIDDIGNKTDVDKQGVLLSSVLWDFTSIFTQAIADVNAGTYGEQDYVMDLSNGGIGLLQTDAIPAEVWAELETVSQGILDGSIEVPLTVSLDEVEAQIGS